MSLAACEPSLYTQHHARYVTCNVVFNITAALGGRCFSSFSSRKNDQRDVCGLAAKCPASERLQSSDLTLGSPPLSAFSHLSLELGRSHRLSTLACHPFSILSGSFAVALSPVLSPPAHRGQRPPNASVFLQLSASLALDSPSGRPAQQAEQPPTNDCRESWAASPAHATLADSEACDLSDSLGWGVKPISVTHRHRQ